MTLKKHKFNIFPEMQAEDYARLKTDLQNNGYDKAMPVYLYQGEVLDGWNRVMACVDIGIQPICEAFIGSDNAAIEFCMRTNKRRNLNSSQWACIAAEAQDMLKAIGEAVEVERRKKQAESLKEAYEEKKNIVCDNKLTQTKTEVPRERVTQKAAELFNTNRTYVSEAVKLKEEQPEKFGQVMRGEKTLTEVKKEVKKDILLAKQSEYQAKVTQNSDTKSIDIFVTDKKFRVIYADPPWSYNDKQAIPGLGGAEKHYQTMPLADICGLPVKNIIANDSVLFLWAVSPLLPEALEVVKAWGFVYKACFVWDKIKHNMGHYNSARHEFLLVGTRGSCTPDDKRLYDSVQSIERSDTHSEKPVEFVNIIDTLYTHGDRVELFARKTRGGSWAFWGNEI